MFALREQLTYAVLGTEFLPKTTPKAIMPEAWLTVRDLELCITLDDELLQSSAGMAKRRLSGIEL